MKKFKKFIAIVVMVSMTIGFVTQAVSLPIPSGGNSGLYNLLFGGTQNGTTYYVDSVSGNDANSGTSESYAWRTLNKVNQVVFKPGDQILFKSGCTFVGQLMPQGSGSKEEGVIHIDKYGGDTLPVINAKGTLENSGAVVRLINQEYWEISNLKLTSPSNGTEGARIGVLVIGKEYGTIDHVYVTNCVIDNVISDISKSAAANKGQSGGELWYGTNAGGGVVFHVESGGEEIPTAFNDILVDNNTIYKLGRSGTGVLINGAYRNIYQQGYYFENDQPDWFPITNVLISNNDISYTTNAILLHGCDGSVGNGVVVENNLVYHPDQYDSNAAVWFSCSNELLIQYNEVYALDNGGSNDCGAFDYDGGVTNCIMQYNYTHHNRGEAVMVCNVHWSSSWLSTNTTDNIFRYNISENDLWGANSGHGRLWVQKGSKNSWFYNNLVYVAEGMPGNNISISPESIETHMYNNLFINYSTNSTWYAPVGDTSRLDMDYNAYYGYAPTAQSWTVDNKQRYINQVGNAEKTFFGGTNSVYLSLSDPLPIVSNDLIGTAVYTGKGTAGDEAAEKTFLRPGADDIDSYLAGFKLNTTADWSAFGGKNPLIDAGKKIDSNSHLGLKDFFENVVLPTETPDIGVHETGSAGVDTQNPESFTISAIATGFDKIKVSWNAVNDNVGISHYVVYVNGDPVDRIYAKSGKTSYTHVVNKLVGSTGPLVDYLLAGTSYKITVRAFDYTANYCDSNSKTVTTKSASKAETTLKISESGTYGVGSGSDAKFFADKNVPRIEFNYNDFVAPRYKIVDGNGDPVVDAWVSVLVSAEGQENNDIIGMLTDENGYAQPAFYAEIYIGDKVKVNISIREVARAGYTYNKTASASKENLTVKVKGYDKKIYGNLAKNGDFDNYYDEMLPTSWGVAVSGGINAVRVAEKSGPDGGNALEISSEDIYTALILQNINDITPGVYTLTMYVKNTAPGASVTVSGKTVSITTTQSWTQISVPNVNVSSSVVQLSIEVAGTPSTYTLIDKVEFSQNLIKNSLFKEKTAGYNLPSDWYFETEKGTLNNKAEVKGSFGTNDASFGAIQPLYCYGKSIYNAIKFQSNNAFNVTIGQDITNIPDDIYTFAMTTINTGNLEGTVTISGYGGNSLTTQIGMSSGESITKIPGINITTGKAKIEINVVGEGAKDAGEYIIIQAPSLAARSDFPEESKRVVFAGDNLLDAINPSFENDNAVTTQSPQGWKVGWTSGQYEFIATDEDAHSGKYCAKATLYDGAAVAVSPALSFTDLPTGYYTVSCWVKGTHRPKFTGSASGVTWDSNAIRSINVSEDNWTCFEIKNLKVTDGKFNLGFWLDTPDGVTQYVLIDDIALYMQENLLDNSSFENGVASGWTLSENKGYSELRAAATSKDGICSARIVLPGTPSTAELVSKSTLSNMYPGTYTFKAWVRGSSELELFAVADGGSVTKSVSAAADVDKWQEVSLTLTIDDSIKKLGVLAKNPSGVTSSYLAIDETSLVKNIVAKDIAPLIGDLNPVKLAEKSIKIPAVRDGFTIELVETSNAAVVALDGTVVHGKNDVIVTLEFKITNKADPNDVAYVTSTVKVFGYGDQASDNTIINDNSQESYNIPATITTVVSGDNNWDIGDIFDGNWDINPDVIGDGWQTIIQPKPAGTSFNLIILLLFVLAIIFILALTFVILLAMKKKAGEREEQII